MQMTIQEYEKKLQDLYGLQGSIAELVIAPVATSLLKGIKARILKGEKSNGGAIGQYSTKPIYAEKEAFAKPSAFKPIGKNKGIGDRLVPTYLLNQSRKLVRGSQFLAILGKNNKKKYARYSQVKNDYTERKTMYIEEGYKGLRDIQSLQTGHIDLKYRGHLLADYQQQVTTQAVIQGFTSWKESEKRNRIEGRFGEVFAPTPNERQEAIDKINFGIRRLTQNTIQGIDVTATIE